MVLPPHDDLCRLALHSIEKKAAWSNDQGTDIFITLMNDIDQESVDCVVVGHGVSASPDGGQGSTRLRVYPARQPQGLVRLFRTY